MKAKKRVSVDSVRAVLAEHGVPLASYIRKEPESDELEVYEDIAAEVTLILNLSLDAEGRPTKEEQAWLKKLERAKALLVGAEKIIAERRPDCARTIASLIDALGGEDNRLWPKDLSLELEEKAVPVVQEPARGDPDWVVKQAVEQLYEYLIHWMHPVGKGQDLLADLVLLVVGLSEHEKAEDGRFKFRERLRLVYWDRAAAKADRRQRLALATIKRLRGDHTKQKNGRKRFLRPG